MLKLWRLEKTRVHLFCTATEVNQHVCPSQPRVSRTPRRSAGARVTGKIPTQITAAAGTSKVRRGHRTPPLHTNSISPSGCNSSHHPTVYRPPRISTTAWATSLPGDLLQPWNIRGRLQTETSRQVKNRDNQMARGECTIIVNRNQYTMAPSEPKYQATASPGYASTTEKNDADLKIPSHKGNRDL